MAGLVYFKIYYNSVMLNAYCIGPRGFKYRIAHSLIIRKPQGP